MSELKTFCSKGGGEIIKARQLVEDEEVELSLGKIMCYISEWICTRERGEVYYLSNDGFKDLYFEVGEVERKEGEVKSIIPKELNEEFNSQIKKIVDEYVKSEGYFICVSQLVKDDSGNNILNHKTFSKILSIDDMKTCVEEYSGAIKERIEKNNSNK